MAFAGDLFVLAPDSNTEHVAKALLHRHQSLNISPIRFEVLADPGRDGGVRKNGHQTAGLKANAYRHCLLLLDFEGCGREEIGPERIELEIEERLRTRWDDRARALVITPEIDIWLWGSDNYLANVLSWNEPDPIRAWLRSRGFELNEHGKPERPKEAIKAVMKRLGLPRSSSNYFRIIESIGLSNCTDPCFTKFRAIMQGWFGA